jgi:hypothetical protein
MAHWYGHLINHGDTSAVQAFRLAQLNEARAAVNLAIDHLWDVASNWDRMEHGERIARNSMARRRLDSCIEHLVEISRGT